jgi:hypothetical protein
MLCIWLIISEKSRKGKIMEGKIIIKKNSVDVPVHFASVVNSIWCRLKLTH